MYGKRESSFPENVERMFYFFLILKYKKRFMSVQFY